MLIFISKSIRIIPFARKISYKIRTAQTNDIWLLDKCNRENLPENYDQTFYNYHLARWPELSFVAENDESEFMGYVIGRLEPKSSGENHLFISLNKAPQYCGHVVSLAIYPKFRGLGISQNLMKNLHVGFLQHYEINEVNLYCRESNIAAKNLYMKRLNYKCDHVVPFYYQNGESACFMTRCG